MDSMKYDLTDGQKNFLKWVVQQMREHKLPEKFIMTHEGFGPHYKILEFHDESPSITESVLDALAMKDLVILNKTGNGLITVSLSTLAYEAVDTEFGEASNPTSPCIFIGHGHSKLWARVKVFLEDEHGLETVTYESESHVGESIIPTLEDLLNKATFAILILTAEDETIQGTKRARQNVVHEAGLFQGRLRFKRAVILRQEGVEEFTNVAGLQDIRFTDDNIEQTFHNLERVLKREGIL